MPPGHRIAELQELQNFIGTANLRAAKVVVVVVVVKF
jgi:hypothetical protein